MIFTVAHTRITQMCVNTQLLCPIPEAAVQQVWGRAHELTFLTSFQVMLIQLLWGSLFGSLACWLLHSSHGFFFPQSHFNYNIMWKFNLYFQMIFMCHTTYLAFTLIIAFNLHNATVRYYYPLNVQMNNGFSERLVTCCFSVPVKGTVTI